MKKHIYLRLGIFIVFVLFSVWFGIKIWNSIFERPVVITKEYIKTGWLLKDTKNFRLAIQEIYPDKNFSIDSLNYSFFKENKYEIDTCLTLFGKKSGDFFGLNDRQKIYFNKTSGGWTWDKVCGAYSSNPISRDRKYILKKNTFYRIMRSYKSPTISYNIYLYVDSLGRVYTYKEKFTPKDI